jgi:hypothetical protein
VDIFSPDWSVTRGRPLIMRASVLYYRTNGSRESAWVTIITSEV